MSSDELGEGPNHLHNAATNEDQREADVTSAGGSTDPVFRHEAAASAGASTAPAREPARAGRVWPALLLLAVLGGVVGAGGLFWLDRAGYLPNGLMAANETGAATSAEIAALRGEIDQLRQADGGGAGARPDAIAPLQQQVAALEQTVAELGLRPPGNADGEALRPIETRLSELERRAGETQPGLGAMETRLAELENRPGAAGADLGPIESQLAELETRLNQAEPAETNQALEARVSEIAGQVDALRTAPPVDLSGVQSAVADLRRRVDEVANRVNAVPTEERVAAIEAATAEAPTAEQVAGLEAALAAVPTEQRIASLESALNETTAVAQKAGSLGPAIAANALTAALEAGQPFTAELDALRALGLDAAALAQLQPHADAGLQTPAELRSGFEDAMAGVDLSRPIANDAGAVGRLLQSARGLVEVRAAGPATGTDPAAVAGRIRAALQGGDLRAALAEWQALPDQAKASSADWARAAEARAAADELAARLRTEALSRIAAAG